jgi:hypothetical protein
MVIAFSTIGDGWWKNILRIKPPEFTSPGRVRSSILLVLGIGVAALSLNPMMNMLSPGQEMNASFEPLHLVNTYGAFGSITRPRYEVVVEGTDEAIVTTDTHWREYEFIGKPGDVNRTPPQIAPYHLRLDWLMWFAAFSTPQEHPWFISFLGRLLENDRAVLGLIRHNPFSGEPPKYVRALLYEYHFTTPEEKRMTGAIWKRKLTGLYFPPASLENDEFRRALTVVRGP